MNMEPLLPVLRTRRRYIAVEVISDEPVDRDSLISAVFSSACSILGDAGAAHSGLMVLGFENGCGFIRCRHTAVPEVLAAVGLVSEINKKRAIIHVKGVSGTIKGARNKAIAADRACEGSVQNDC